MPEFDTPEDLFGSQSELGKKIIAKFQKLNKGVPFFIILFLAVILLSGSFYSVGPDEIGVVRRFGKYVCSTDPGLHLKIPVIERVDNVKVKYIFKEEFGFRTERSGVVSQYSQRQYFDESLMLTGDLNVLEVEWIVQFRVKDAVKLLFNVRNPNGTVRNISEAVMRQVVGNHTVNEVLTMRRLEINQEVQDMLQDIMDFYESGVQIVTVRLQDVNPPDAVKPSFNGVNEAKQEREKMINQAWEAYNKVIPRARGEAEKTISQAEGYAVERVNTAQGDAAKFIATYTAYKTAPEVTRKRLYLETMNTVIPRAGKKFIMDPSQKGILPFLDLTGKGGAQ